MVIKIEGGSLKDCLARAAGQLGIPEKQIVYSLIQSKSKGLFGFGSKPCIIEVTGPTGEMVTTPKDGSTGTDSVEPVSAGPVNEAPASPETDETTDQDSDEKESASKNRDTTRDGKFDIEVSPAGVFLTVTKHQEGGREIDLFRVKLEVEQRKIVRVNYSVAEMTILQATGKPVKVAEYDPAVYHDGKADIRISRDGMRCFLTLVEPHCGRKVSCEDVMRRLKLSNVTLGINHEAIKACVVLDRFDQEVLIAEGIPPIDGEDAVIDYKFQVKATRLKPHELKDGSVDFRELDLIINVTKGELLAEKNLPTDGKEGRMVTGEAIPPRRGRDCIIRAGLNTSLSDDRLRLYSLIDGLVTIGVSGVRVIPILEIPGDVDFTVGNVDFIGTVFIHGKVLDGFTVKAREDITIAKNVEGAHIKAGGSVKIKMGIVGKERAVVEADGDIYAKFVENATLRAAGNIIIGSAILHSNCTAGGSIKLDGNKTTICGGEIKAGILVDAHVIGSPLGTMTSIEVGVDPDLSESLRTIHETLILYIEKHSTLEKSVTTLMKLKNMGNLSEQKEELLKKSVDAVANLAREVQRLEHEKAEVVARIGECKGGEVKGRTVIYPGVKVSIATAVRYIKEELKASSLVFERGEIRVGQI